jgi:DNA repair exonuclease SbcCD ATPase subunit
VALWFLHSIEINGGFLPGLGVEFPKGLTCIIGPRGTGKSTLAEAIRFALGASKSASRTTRDLIEKNLSGAVITITTTAGTNGAGYQVRRSGRQAPTLSTASGEAVTGVDLERGSFLPLDAYSTNEVEDIADESLGEKRRSLLDDLRSEELAHIQVAIADRLRALEANRDAIRLSESTLANLRERIEELAEAPAKLAALPPHSEGDGDGLARVARQAQMNQREGLALDQLTQLVDDFSQRVAKLIGSFPAAPGPLLVVEGSANTDLMAGLGVQVAERLRKAASFLTQAETELQAIPGLFTEFRDRLATGHSAQQADLVRLQQENLAASQAVQQRADAEQSVAKLREFQHQLQEEETKLNLLREARKALKGGYLLERERVSDLRSQIAAQLQVEAGEKVRVRVLRNADSFAFQQMLAAGLQGAGQKP